VPVDVSFHPLDEALVSAYFNRGLVDGTGVVDIDTASKVVLKKNMVELVSNFFRQDAEQQLSGKGNFQRETTMFGRPYFLTGSKPEEVVEVLKLLDQAQTPEEIFDIFHRQAEHVDFEFAGHKAAHRPVMIQQMQAMQNLGPLRMQMYDWLDKKVYRYAMTRFAGFFAKGKIKKFKPKRMTAEEEVFFKKELKRKPEELSVDIGTMLGHDTATIMTTMYPTWNSRQVGLTDLKAWVEHLFPMIESPHYLFTRLPTYNFLEKHIPKRVRTGLSGGCIKSSNIGQFIDALNSGKGEIVSIFDRVGHYKEMALNLVDRLTEAGKYALQRGFGLIEASEIVKPY
jgi:stalled ribosome alternative rescue factor ArfA